MENNNTERKNWIRAYIVDVLPCISIAFFILSYVYYSAFYAVFGIDILQYATFGDILLGITEHLVSFALFSILATGVGCFTYGDDKTFYNANGKENVEDLDIIVYLAIIIVSMIVSMLIIWIIVIYLIDYFEKYIIDFDNVSFPFFLYFPLLFSNIFTPLLHKIPRSIAVKILFMNKKFIVFLIIFFYVHSFVMFGALGVLDGLKKINRDNIKFEIRTVGGCVYNDTIYRYISHLSGNTFLYNKKTKENVILYNDNIEYSKIKDRDFHINFILKSYKHKLKNK